MGIGERGVRYGDGDGRPIGAEPAAKAVGVVARSEIVVSGFGVAFLCLLSSEEEKGTGARGAPVPQGRTLSEVQTR